MSGEFDGWSVWLKQSQVQQKVIERLGWRTVELELTFDFYERRAVRTQLFQ
jgi:hypothetical protein